MSLSLSALIVSRLCILISLNFLFALSEVINLNKKEKKQKKVVILRDWRHWGRLAEVASGELRGFRVAYLFLHR